MHTLLAAVHELTGVHALSSDEKLLVEAVLVGVLELNLGEGGTPARVVDDVLHHTLDVALALGKVELTVLGGALPVEDVRLHEATSNRMSDQKRKHPQRTTAAIGEHCTREGIASRGKGDEDTIP
jgi:hypothetical protein